MARGTLVHAVLQRLQWAEDGAPPGDASEADVAELVKQRLAARGATWQNLSREKLMASLGAGFELQVRTEVPILTGPEQSGSGRIDRLVIATKSGRPVWAQVIDFKTGKVPLEAEGEEFGLFKYRDQVRGYMSAVAAALRLDPSKVTGALLFIDADETVEVEPA